MSSILDLPQRYRPPMRSRGLRAGVEWRTQDLVFQTNDDGTLTAVTDDAPELLLTSRHFVASAALGHHWFVDLPDNRFAVYRIVEYFGADEAYGLEKISEGYRDGDDSVVWWET